MTDVSLSVAEKTFILHGVDANFRNDGRERCQYRWIEIESKIMEQVNGSARIRIGTTDVMVGVKVEIDTPYPERPYEGKLEFFVDCSANATPSFEGKGGDDIATDISNQLALAYTSPEAMDLRFLSIIPNKKCWKMFIDILILQCGGNLLDAVAIAVKSALYNTEIPRVTSATLDGGEPDIVVSDDIYNCVKLDISNFPLFVTLCKIGDNYIVDPSPEEDVCSSASVSMSVTPTGKVTSVTKNGYGSLQIQTLNDILEMGTKIAMKLNGSVTRALQKEEEIGPKKPIYGFLR